MADKDIILEVRDLKKYFKSPTGTLHAVDGVNFSIRRGETLGLVGESGCGKSTIGRLILGLHQSTSGEILFNGQDICKMNKKQLHDLRKDLQIIKEADCIGRKSNDRDRLHQSEQSSMRGYMLATSALFLKSMVMASPQATLGSAELRRCRGTKALRDCSMSWV